jgi:hypothetical protein
MCEQGSNTRERLYNSNSKIVTVTQNLRLVKIKGLNYFWFLDALVKDLFYSMLIPSLCFTT